MRPLQRGRVPQVGRRAKKVAHYRDWRMDLINRLGNFCCYCNMVLNDSPQVEHVAPKSRYPRRALHWKNMLLACGPCNIAKSNTHCSHKTHLLPDCHNTFLGFDHEVLATNRGPACVVKPRAGLSPDMCAKALSTIALCKLDLIKYNSSATDLRWKYRWEALEFARAFREMYDELICLGRLPEVFYKLLSQAARSKGFFSVWMDVFKDAPLVIKTLLATFPGTNKAYFV